MSLSPVKHTTQINQIFNPDDKSAPTEQSILVAVNAIAETETTSTQNLKDRNVVIKKDNWFVALLKKIFCCYCRCYKKNEKTKEEETVQSQEVISVPNAPVNGEETPKKETEEESNQNLNEAPAATSTPESTPEAVTPESTQIAENIAEAVIPETPQTAEHEKDPEPEGKQPSENDSNNISDFEGLPYEPSSDIKNPTKRFRDENPAVYGATGLSPMNVSKVIDKATGKASKVDPGSPYKGPAKAAAAKMAVAGAKNGLLYRLFGQKS